MAEEVNEPVGNAAAMREALVKTSQFLSKLGEWLKVNDEGQEYALAAGMIHTLVEHALSAPPRNCEVGTPEERLHRYHNLCREISDRYDRIGERAPLLAFPTAFEWEDRPYEKGGAE